MMIERNCSLEREAICVDRRCEVGCFVTDLLEQNEQLVEIANRSHVSGLLNKRAFIGKYAPNPETLIDRRLQGEENTFFTRLVFAIDLDGFKKLNDRLGHRVGDEALLRFGKILYDCFRADKGDEIYHLSGDEFAGVVPGILYPEIIEARIQYSLNEDDWFNGKGLGFTIGFAMSEMGGSVLEAYNKADDQVNYKKKSEGKR